MASHAGLILVLKNKDGYVDQEGNIVKDKDQARPVTFYEAGFSDASKVLERLGLDNGSIDKESLTYETLIPSYDSRLGDIEEYLREMGYGYHNACQRAASYFEMLDLYNYDKFKKYIKELEKQTREYCCTHTEPTEEIIVDGQKISLHLAANPYSYSREGYKKEKFYSINDTFYKYSIRLKNPHVEKYFTLPKEEQDYYNNWQNIGLMESIKKVIAEYNSTSSYPASVKSLSIENNELKLFADYISTDLTDLLNSCVQEHYSKREMHITRMFGSYIILQRIDGVLKSTKATEVPIKYCPLMIKLLKEVGGEKSDELIRAISEGDKETSSKLMLKLIDEVVIAGGYFDTSRPLNSCEANVLFGASETISSAFTSNMLDAAVIVSNNLGTIITTNNSNTQGAVKRMTGLFYTSPSSEIVQTAKDERIIPVFPYTAEIDQIAGIKEAISRGYKRIAVTFAAGDNRLLSYVKELEREGITIYKFGLCSTGIDELTARTMLENADIIWSCASKYVKELIEPNAIAQVGIKIPVHIMTKKGWELVKNHLSLMNSSNDFTDLSLSMGETKPVILNTDSGIKKLTKKDIHHCADCPTPCI